MDIYFCEYGMIRLLMNLFLELVKKGRRGMKMKLKKNTIRLYTGWNFLSIIWM